MFEFVVRRFLTFGDQVAATSSWSVVLNSFIILICVTESRGHAAGLLNAPGMDDQACQYSVMLRVIAQLWTQLKSFEKNPIPLPL